MGPLGLTGIGTDGEWQYCITTLEANLIHSGETVIHINASSSLRFITDAEIL